MYFRQKNYYLVTLGLRLSCNVKTKTVKAIFDTLKISPCLFLILILGTGVARSLCRNA